MSKVITFLKQIPQEDRLDIIGRAWGKFARRQHYIHTEVARMRQSGCSESEIQKTISAWSESGSKPQLSLSECMELGMPIDGDVVTTIGSRRDSE